MPLGGTRRPRPHGGRCARPMCILALSGASEHAPGASHVSISNPRRDPGWRCHRGSSATRRGQAPTRSRPWRPRAILADPDGLWWWARARGVARPPGRGLEPQATNLRVPQAKILARRRFATPKQGSPYRPRGAKQAWPDKKSDPRKFISRLTCTVARRPARAAPSRHVVASRPMHSLTSFSCIAAPA